MKIIISELAIHELMQAGAPDLQSLADMVAEHPRGKAAVDMHSLECCGVPLSWIRDHKLHSGTILTRREAARLDLQRDPTFCF